MSNPFLSVIIPVYNVEPFLAQCLDSLLAQTFTDFEALLIDDGSTDSSGAICDSYARKDARFRCFHKENGGHTSARQMGIQHASGDYVTFVDSDDWISPDMYQEMCRAAKDTGADTVCCNYIAVTPEKKIKRTDICPPGFYDKKKLEEQLYPSMLFSGSFFHFGISPSLCNKLFRRPLIEKNIRPVPLSIKVGEDALVSYICLLESSSVYFCEACFYYYRSSSSSLTHTMDKKRLAENHTLFDSFLTVIDCAAYPCMERQLAYYFAYQCLLTFAPVFSNMPSRSEARRLFLSECAYPPIKKAFRTIRIRDINGRRNKLHAICIRHGSYRLFHLFLTH